MPLGDLKLFKSLFTNLTCRLRLGEDDVPALTSGKQLFLKGLILAQNERWRRGLGMQVERRQS